MILITGGAGYIGSHTAINFLNKRFDILIFDNLENGHIQTINTLKNIGNVEFIKGDLRNIDEIEQAFKKNKIDAVIHFAAYALVGESVENPAKYYRNNTFGTLNLLDSMLKYNVKNIVFSSSCATYGEPIYTPIDEKHPQNPINPYGASKLMVERIMHDYDIAYGIKSIKLRYFNVAGCDEDSRIGEIHTPETHLIPNIIKANCNNSTFKIYGNNYATYDGTCIRDYVNVEDLAEAHYLAYKYLIENQKSNEFNLGTEHGNSVREIIETCENIINKKIKIKIEARRPGDPAKLIAKSKKAFSILNWKPKRTLENSIKSAYNWEKNIDYHAKEATISRLNF